MPRLFVSHRQQPAPVQPATQQQQQQRPTPRARVPSLLAAPVVPIAMPSPSPPPTAAVVAPRPPPGATNEDGAPLVLVPPVPASLARLMDSHDLDNPYLVAAFNVLIDNNNNPMRVPDILQAVQRKGWTQVLHRHKDRPEQLFGNALRSHQRRREMINKPSLAFMIDAGSCWKHHQLDLSAASGRKKGKIWCFSKAAGFPCPYARLGLNLDIVVRAQEGGAGGSGANDDNDEGADEEPQARPPPQPKTQEPARKKRKLVAANAKPAALLEQAVRGGVTPAHPVVSIVEPPPYIPAATKAQEVPYGTRSSRAAAIVQSVPALPLEIVPRLAKQTRGRAAARAQTEEPFEEDEVDLEALTAMSPEPEHDMMLIDDEESAVHDAGLEEVAPMEIHAELVSALAALSSPTVSWLPSTPLTDPKLEAGYISDDDEDDFHVTMNNFSTIETSPLRAELEAYMMSSTAPSPTDGSSSDGGASFPRTPTPPPQESANSIAMWSLQTSESSVLDSYALDAPFHSVGLGYDLGGWDNSPMIIKTEPEDQGWSRAGSTFGSFSAGGDKDAHDVRSIADADMDVASLVMEPLEMDAVPFPGASFLDTMSVGSARSREGSFLSVRMDSRRGSVMMESRRGSVAAGSTPASPLITALPDFPEAESRRLSVHSSSSHHHHSHPLILYSPSLAASSVGSDAPFKSGLAHRYLVDMHPDGVEAEDDDVEDLEDLLNLDDDVELPAPALTYAPAPSRPIGIKRPRSPSF